MNNSLAIKIALCVIIIFIAALLGSYKVTLPKEYFVDGAIIDPAYNVFNNDNITSQPEPLCNVFTCKYKPKQPLPYIPPPQPAPIIVNSQPAPVCPTEITIDDINNFNIYTPEEQAVEDRIAEKQAELNELERQKEQSLAAYKEQEQATQAGMDQMISVINELKVASLRQQNADNVPENPIQKMLINLDEKITKLETKIK
jgi:hypothetical protein